MPPAPIGTHTPPRPPAGIIGTHTPPRPPAGMRRPLGVLQNAWLEPGRDDLLNRNQLPLNTDTFGRRGGSCSKQTLVITTPCSSPNTRSALSALGPPLVEMNCAIDSPSRCPASRAGLFGALAQIAFAIQDSDPPGIPGRRCATTARLRVAAATRRSSTRTRAPPQAPHARARASLWAASPSIARPPAVRPPSEPRARLARTATPPAPTMGEKQVRHPRARPCCPRRASREPREHARRHRTGRVQPRSSPLLSLAQEADSSGGRV